MILVLAAIILALIGLVAYLVHRLERAVAAGADRMVAIVDRIEHMPQVVLHPAVPSVPQPEARAYISDFEYDDQTWNEFMGAEAANEEAEVE